MEHSTPEMAVRNPDHDIIATFRRRFLKDIEELFVNILLLAREVGVPNMGTIGLEPAPAKAGGTKILGHASPPQRLVL